MPLLVRLVRNRRGQAIDKMCQAQCNFWRFRLPTPRCTSLSPHQLACWEVSLTIYSIVEKVNIFHIEKRQTRLGLQCQTPLGLIPWLLSLIPWLLSLIPYPLFLIPYPLSFSICSISVICYYFSKILYQLPFIIFLLSFMSAQGSCTTLPRALGDCSGSKNPTPIIVKV